MYEVLETSWEELMRNLDSSTNLDMLIEAHSHYLEKILERSLISADKGGKGTSDAMALLPKLHGLFGLILRFAALQEQMYVAILEEAHLRALQDRTIESRTRGGGWGIVEDDIEWDSLNATATSSLFGADTDAGGPSLVTEYGAQIANITEEYGSAFREFLDTLRSSSVDTLQFLAFRMDYSDHYAKHDHEKESDSQHNII